MHMEHSKEDEVKKAFDASVVVYVAIMFGVFIIGLNL